MHAKPLHPDPTVAPPPQEWMHQPSGAPAPAGAASSTQVLGTAAPQITVDYRVARDIASQVARQREELLKTKPDMDRDSE